MGCDKKAPYKKLNLTGFNPRTHVGCDTEDCELKATVYCFNPRTHVGCDGAGDIEDDTPAVSIHAPTWGATPLASTHLSLFVVSIHAPTWGATAATIPTSYYGLFQSTHPRGVRLKGDCTHCIVIECFNPRTHVGCDEITNFVFLTISSFNPRTHVGCDVVHRAYVRDRCVSIHAPTWGATRKQQRKGD